VFGFNGLGELAYKRSYSRVKDDGNQEEWQDTVTRVVEGTFSMQRRHFEQEGIKWQEEEQKQLAMRMFDKIINMKFLPPGRGLWAMGTKLTEKKGLYAALNNCAFVTTGAESVDEFVRAFTFLMDSSMLGIGVGFDTKGAGKYKVHKPQSTVPFAVPDSREGWVTSLQLLLDSYFKEGVAKPTFDYSQIRPPGLPLKTFGGTSSGYKHLEDMHMQISSILDRVESVTSRTIVDIMNIIGQCVVAGNIRRVAEIAFGDAKD